MDSELRAEVVEAVKMYSAEVASIWQCSRPRVRVLSDTEGPSLTKQAEAETTDINLIVARHMRHDVPFYPDGRARYGDFSGSSDFHAIVDRVKAAQDSFDRLPPEVRKACANDPGMFLDMLGSAEGVTELGKLGLLEVQVPADKAAKGEPASPDAPAGAGSTVIPT